MSTPPPPKTIAVVGATGHQGNGTIRALLSPSPSPSPSQKFTVVALTRNPSSPSAQRLLSEFGHDRLRLVKADLYDVGSLREAFRDVDGVFSITSDDVPGGKAVDEESLKHQLAAGKNVVEAAKACGVKHFVMSSLPNITKASNGKYTKVFHFDHKNEIEELARKTLPAVTVLYPADGTVRFCLPIDGKKLADWVDPARDIGIYAAAAFAAGPELTASKTYPVVGAKFPLADFAKIFQAKTGERAVYQPATLDEWGKTVAAAAGPGFEEDIRQMAEWIAEAPDEKICYGTMDPKDDLSAKDLGVRASTFEEWLERSGWRAA
ncbi:MAG: hypothetical protein M1834_006781 [Cirrosporium novae-zelandiae]|nr:MAG: hypothetical protein M1834_006781 [Cirrosporium novae-zelandiae]